MCTYQTSTIEIHGSGKVVEGWKRVDEATIYFDHPVHFAAGHALMIDVRSNDGSPTERIALEMDGTSARRLAETILATLDSVPAALVNETSKQ